MAEQRVPLARGYRYRCWDRSMLLCFEVTTFTETLLRAVLRIYLLPDVFETFFKFFEISSNFVRFSQVFDVFGPVSNFPVNFTTFGALLEL